MPAVSVIIPVYKVEAYLRPCVDSVLAQTFSDYEIILVDDGSPDSCGDICDEYAAKDTRIRVIHQKNQGLSAARNNAVPLSTGEYVCFVDSDDRIHPQMLELLMAAARQTGAKICIGGLAREEHAVFSNTYSVADQQPEVIDWAEACGRLCWIRNKTGRIRSMDEWHPYVVAHTKLIARNIVEKFPFPVGRRHEDEFTAHHFLHEAQTVAVLPLPLYYYRKNPNGITAIRDISIARDEVDAQMDRYAFFKEQNMEELMERTKNSWWFSEYAILCKAQKKKNDLPREFRVPVPLALWRMKNNTTKSRFSEYLHMAYPLLAKIYVSNGE